MMFVTETKGVVSVFESKMNRLHTTNSWRFLGVDSIPKYNLLNEVDRLDLVFLANRRIEKWVYKISNFFYHVFHKISL